MYNKTYLYILLVIGIVISSIFYTIASYSFRYAENYNIKFRYIFIFSLLFGLISYSIKIPVYYFFGKRFSIFVLNILFLIITFIFVVMYSYFILHEKIDTHTYIIITIIVCLLIINDILSMYKKN